MVTLAPELPGALDLITRLQSGCPSLVVSLGHSTASFATGLAALDRGAGALTHVFNAMAPLHHREPGLAGLMGQSHGPSSSRRRPYYSVIADGIHLHPSVLRMALRADPDRCILITDSIELAGLPDGIYPGNGQVVHRQRKVGSRVTLVKDGRDIDENGEGEDVSKSGEKVRGGEGEEVLIGSCCTLDICVRNMISMTGCGVAEAVRCVTENVAGLMAERKRGVLEPGRRADFVILDSETFRVKETWVQGSMVFSSSETADRGDVKGEREEGG